VVEGNRKTFKWMLWLTLLLVTGGLHAIEPSRRSQFDQAVEAYRNNQFEQALEGFVKANKTADSAGLYFNIGNCHIKMGNLGQAMSAYYSALSRDPANPNIRHNLEFARSLMRDQIVEDTDIRGIMDVVRNLIRRVSLKAHQILFCALYLMIFGLTGISLLIHRSAFRYKGSIGVLVVMLFLQGVALSMRVAETHRKMGVVSAKEMKVRYGPSYNDTEAFVLHEGMRFVIHRKSGRWIQIELADGKVGWAPEELTVRIR